MQKKILVIDDNTSILFSMQKALEMKGHEVLTAQSFEGIQKIAEIAPDLIYLDVSLVEDDGREVSQKLKADKTTKNIPIIILTAYSGADHIAEEALADSFLAKPFELTELWSKTEEYS